jgi:hypothetical protein
MKHQSLRLVLLFLLRYERILTPLCDSPSRRMGFAFERKPSGSLLTSGGAKNLRQRRIPLFQACHTNWNLSIWLICIYNGEQFHHRRF